MKALFAFSPKRPLSFSSISSPFFPLFLCLMPLLIFSVFCILSLYLSDPLFKHHSPSSPEHLPSGILYLLPRGNSRVGKFYTSLLASALCHTVTSDTLICRSLLLLGRGRDGEGTSQAGIFSPKMNSGNGTQYLILNGLWNWIFFTAFSYYKGNKYLLKIPKNIERVITPSYCNMKAITIKCVRLLSLYFNKHPMFVHVYH